MKNCGNWKKNESFQEQRNFNEAQRGFNEAQREFNKAQRSANDWTVLLEMKNTIEEHSKKVNFNLIFPNGQRLNRESLGLLTIAQAREVKNYYYKHYQSYPTNTIEGNPILREDVKRNKAFNLKHFITSIIIGTIVFFCLKFLPKELHEFFVGIVFGVFLLVIVLIY